MKPLAIINKHVRTDGKHEYYLNPANGKWEAGRYDGRVFHWIRTRQYSARHRDYTMQDGSKIAYRLTRYTKRNTHRPAQAPIGKTGRAYSKAVKDTVADIYYRDGKFFEAYNLETSKGKFVNSVRPYSGKIWDAYPEQSERAGIPPVSIWCTNGEPRGIELDGERYNVSPEEWAGMYVHVLQVKDVDQSKRAA